MCVCVMSVVSRMCGYVIGVGPCGGLRNESRFMCVYIYIST
jgi:hypothetical protein